MGKKKLSKQQEAILHRKKQIKVLLDQKLLQEAQQQLLQLQELMEKDSDFYLLEALLHLQSGALQRALPAVQQALKLNPHRFDLLYYQGYIHEQRQEFVHAWDSYQKAGHVQSKEKQRDEVKKAMARVNAHVGASLKFSPDHYTIIITGNPTPLTFHYSLRQLKERKELLHTLLSVIGPSVATILELECGEGIVSRCLWQSGFEVMGRDSDPRAIHKALALTMTETLRHQQQYIMPPFEPLFLDETSARTVPKTHCVILAPGQAWFQERGEEKFGKIMEHLLPRATKELFLYLPSGDGEMQTKCIEQIERLGQKWHKHLSSHEPSNADWRLFRLGKKYKHRKVPVIPKGLEVLHSTSRLLHVPMDSFVDGNAFSFSPTGWHPFVAFLKEYLQNPHINYEDSILKRFYQAFTPENRQEQLLPHIEEDLYPLSAGWPNVPWMSFSPEEIPREFTSPLMEMRGGNQTFGPNSSAFGQEEMGRLITTYKLMKKGYEPEIYPDGFINGYLLLDGDAHRFYVTEGLHRLAALSVLGYETVTCRFDPDPLFPSVVDIKDISKWPQVQKGLYSETTAETVFRVFFARGDIEKAEALHLLQ